MAPRLYPTPSSTQAYARVAPNQASLLAEITSLHFGGTPGYTPQMDRTEATVTALETVNLDVPVSVLDAREDVDEGRIA